MSRTHLDGLFIKMAKVGCCLAWFLADQKQTLFHIRSDHSRFFNSQMTPTRSKPSSPPANIKTGVVNDTFDDPFDIAIAKKACRSYTQVVEGNFNPSCM
ncbi:hypothetical protein HanIR_Chr10g0459341 [Helianthus annuus]|nr:hypothetical protein HanIR_Chr10g0459341 [Helianthus annuus]